MKEGVEVVICGTGPMWAGIEESLRKLRRFRVRQLDGSLAEAVYEVSMLSPHAILFDISKAEPAVVAAILRTRLRTRLIGLRGETPEAQK